jgi:acetyltransferase-like isoleucine patch superfamily enzyme
MIAATVNCSHTAGDSLIVRGKDLQYWLSHFYPSLNFIEKLHAGRNFDYLFVFGTCFLPLISEAAMRELRRRLQSQNDSDSGLFAPAGKSFFIARRSFLNTRRLALKPGLFNALLQSTATERWELKNPIPVLDTARQPQKIEAEVIALQVRYLQKRGVRIENFTNFYLEGLPVIGRDSVLGSGVIIKGDCLIGKKVIVYANCFIEKSRIGDGCILLPGSIVRDSIVEKNVQLGPYCHLRNGSRIRQGAKMGNFVEMKKSVLGRGSKAMHLTYIGDAQVGKKVNIGAGTITCNYDGEKKNPTRIGDNVFIGSGTELVAPVTLHSDSYVAAGSTITDDVPRHALAVARQRQRNIKGWVLRKRKK